MTREEAYLTVVEGWLRDNRGIVFTEGAVDDLCDRIAAEIGRLRGIKQFVSEASRHEVEGLRTDNARLRALVKDLADDLEAELNGYYPPEIRAYPSEQRRYERNMANVYEARRALEHKP